MTDGMKESREDSASMHLTPDMCIDLLWGFIDEEASRSIENHLRTCPGCEEMLRAAVADLEALRSRGEPRLGPDGKWILEQAKLELGTEMAGASREALPSLRGVGKWLRRRYALAAAAAAGLVFILLISKGAYRRGEGLEYWIPADRPLRTLRSAAPAERLTTLRQGIAAYGERDLDRAIEILSGLNLEEPYESLRSIYLSSALALKGRYQEASQVLSSLDTAALPEPWRSEARWIRYVVLAETGHRNQARALLEELSKLDNDIGVRARKRLKKLGNQ